MGAPGCDDAPVVAVPRGDAPKSVTLIYPYYENPEFFARQLAGWSEYPLSLLKHVRFVVVDDGSPRNPAADVVRRAAPVTGLSLYRIGVDVRWNWLAARNIGAHHAREGWLLLTDMDHVVTEDVLRSVVYGRHDESTIYRFSRVEHTGQQIHPHPNSWLMTRRMFWKIGGYDEACSGYYGTDGDYRRRCAATARIRILTDCLERHEYQGDSSTIDYKRKQPEDARAKQIMRARPKNWRPRVLSFPYQAVNV